MTHKVEAVKLFWCPAATQGLEVEGQRHTASEISFQVPENSVTWSVTLTAEQFCTGVEEQKIYMDLCFLICWLHVIKVLMATLKLEHNILYILICILTPEVSCILFITKWDYSFGTQFSMLMTSTYISCALYLCIYFCSVLFLQAGSLGEVPWCCSTKYSLPFLVLQSASFPLSYYCSSALQFNFTSVCWQCPLTSIFPSKKMGSAFFCLSGIFTPELVNLKNSAYSPLWGFWVPVDFHSWFGYTF